MEGKDRREGKKIESKRKGLAETARGRQEGDMRGLASTRGFPNCAMSLSVIDRFASAINTGHQALATPYTSLSLAYSLPSTDHPRIYPLQRLSLSLSLHPSSSLTTQRSSTAFIVVIPVCLSLSLSLSLFLLLPPFSLFLSLNEGRKTLTFKRASEGEHGALPPSHGAPLPHLVSPAFPSSPLATHYRPVFSTAAFKLQRWPSSLSLISLLQRVKLHRCFFAIS